MGTLTITKYLIRCDGCGTPFGVPDAFDNAMEARAMAYAQGWRFPNQISANGKTLKSNSDACPDCVPNWTPRPRESTARPLTIGEWQVLIKEAE